MVADFLADVGNSWGYDRPDDRGVERLAIVQADRAVEFGAAPTDNLSIRLIGTHGEQSYPTISPVILSVYNPAALQARMAAAGYTLLVGNAEDRLINIDTATFSLKRPQYNLKRRCIQG